MQAVKILFIQTTITAVALCLLWQSRLVRRTGHQLDLIKQQTANVEAQIQRCEAHLSKLKSPQRIMRLVKTLDLNLVHPTTRQIVSRPSHNLNQQNSNSPELLRRRN